MIKDKKPAFTLTRKALLLVSIPLLFQLIFVAYLASQLRQAEQKIQEEARSKQTISDLDMLVRVTLEAGTAMASYGITAGSRVDMLDYEKSKDEFARLLPGLKSQLKDDPEAIAMLSVIEDKTNEIMSQSENIMTLVEAGSQFPDPALMLGCLRLRGMIAKLEKAVGILSARESAKAATLPSMGKNQWLAVKLSMAFAILVNIGLAIGLTVWVNRSTTRRMSVLMDNTVRLSEGRKLKPEVKGTDEIAQLDKTFRKMAANLAASRRKEQAIIQNAQDVLCSLDSDATFIAVSSASLKVWGYPPEELVGSKLLSILADQENDRVVSLVASSAGSGGSSEFECRVNRKDGKTIHTLWSTKWSGEDHSLVCVSRDISDRKKIETALKSSQERITLILNSMPLGLLVTDANGRIELVNTALNEMLGYEQENLKGRHLQEIIAPSGEEADSDEQTAMFANRLGQTVVRKASTFSGQTLPVDFTLDRFSIDNKQMYLAVLADITQRQEIERMKQEFVSIVSHDLRTPLTSVQAFLTMLCEGMFGAISEQGNHEIAAAEKGAEGLTALINNLLDIEKLEAGLLRIELEEAAMDDIVDRAVDAVIDLADDSNVFLDVDVEPVVACVDSNRLVQVLVNLMDNAIKASGPNTTVAVAVKDTGDAVELKVTDEGCGIPDHKLDSIFERFGQVTAGRSTKQGGVGLGLPLCRAIVKEHKGMIGVDSKIDSGSTFVISLPKTGRESQI